MGYSKWYLVAIVIHEYEWWADRIEIDRMESETPGSRSFFGSCPVHGGSDSLHVTEKNGKGAVFCFGCQASYQQIVDALDTVSEVDSQASQATENEPPQLLVVRRSSSSQPGTALDWCAQRVGITRAALDALKLPLSEDDNILIFEFEGRAQKTREVGEGKKKAITWRGTQNPPLWPVPSEPDIEITITEGEFDCIALRAAGYDAYSITGGSSNVPDVFAFQALKHMGVERIVIAFDEDEPGRKARKAVAEAIREAGLIALYGRPKGLEPLYDEKDARDVSARVGTVELEDHPETDLAVRILTNIQPAVEESLLIGRLDPNDHTILFGDGGTGKGVIAAWWTSQLVKDGKVVLVLDYENHAETEWRKRLDVFAPGNLDSVFVVSPTSAIWDIAGSVAELIKELRVDYVIVDSAIYACVGADAYTPEAATKYSLAISQFGKPVLTLAHKTKSKDEQSKPFGSVFWHNGARLIISVDAKGYDDERILKTTKSNHGDDFHISIPWGWVRTGLEPLVENNVALGVTATLDDLIIRAVEEGHASTRSDIDNYVLASNPDAKNIANRILALKASGMITYDKATKEYGPKEDE